MFKFKIFKKLNKIIINLKKIRWIIEYVNWRIYFYYKFTNLFLLIKDIHKSKLIADYSYKFAWKWEQYHGFTSYRRTYFNLLWVTGLTTQKERNEGYTIIFFCSHVGKKFFKKIVFYFTFFNFISNLFFTRLIILLNKFFNFLIYLKKNYLAIYLKKNYYLYILLKYLKYMNFFSFKILIDFTVIDYINYNLKKRFKMVYNLFSIKFNYRLFINLFVNIKEGFNSLILLFSNLNWLEREIWDMFGVIFFNHFDFRRILTDYGFKWFPLRKDFPVSGYIELWYDEILRDITYRPLKLQQELRFYNLTSTWENLL